MADIYIADAGFDHGFFEGSSCAFGVFDGLHCGHQYLLACAQETAAMKPEGKAIALTFDIDPDEVFHSDRLKKLMSNEERIDSLSRSGVDAVVVLPFTKAFSSASPKAFLETTFNGQPPGYLHVGYDFRFGAKAAGTVKELKCWAGTVGSRICAHDLKSADGAPITATRIRGFLSDGRIAEANKLLGHPYSITAVVQPGRQEGQGFGFRTANMKVPPMRQALAEGVYAAFCIVDGKRYKAAVSVGVSPVFAGKTDATCEAHLIDFEGDLYGRNLTVEFMHYLRPMIAFESTDELISTVLGNIAWARDNLVPFDSSC